MAEAAFRVVSVEDYLRSERDNLARHEYTETALCLIVEVLSASTRSEDQVYKAERYRELPTLRGYLMVDSQSRAAALCRRTAEGWVLEVVEEAVQLSCPEMELSLDTVYEAVGL